jgi:hypothetical protein
MAKRPRSEIVRAVRRVQEEGPVSVRELSSMAGCSFLRMTGWIIKGKHGTFLDGFKHPVEGWKSSRAALARFLAEAARVEEGSEKEVAHHAEATDTTPSVPPDPDLAVLERLAEEQVLPVERFADVLGLPSATPIARWIVLGVRLVKLDGVADSMAGFVMSAPALNRFRRELATTPTPPPAVSPRLNAIQEKAAASRPTHRKEGCHHGTQA